MKRKYNLIMKLLPKYYHQFYLACINLYGVIDSNNAFVIFKKYYPSATKKDFLKDIRNRNGKFTKKYTIWTVSKRNVYLIADDSFNEKDIHDTLSFQLDKPFYEPNTIEELINESSYEYWNITNSGHIKEIASILSIYKEDNKHSIIETIYDWMRYLSRKQIINPLGEIINRLIRWGYIFNEKELFVVMKSLQKIWNNTKLPCNRGYSPIELRKLSEIETTKIGQC